jgi:hypothetical protein
MSAPEIARTTESLGASIDSGAGWDASGATVVMMSDKANEALKVLADVVRHPAFKQEEIDRLKSQRLDGLRVALQQSGSLARFGTARTVYGTGAYGHAVSGTLETVQAITRDQIVRLYQQYYEPRNTAFVLAGDITLEQGKAFAGKFRRLEKQRRCANERVRSGAAVGNRKHRDRYAGNRTGGVTVADRRSNAPPSITYSARWPMPRWAWLKQSRDPDQTRPGAVLEAPRSRREEGSFRRLLRRKMNRPPRLRA